MAYFIGIDTSTTATKALLMDQTGTVLAVSAQEYGFETPHPLWSEQAPSLWWDATIASICGVLEMSGVAGSDVVSIGLSGQMHGLVLLGDTGSVLRPAILWNDQRTATECDEIRSRLGGLTALVAETGNDALTGFTAPKLLWVRNNEPEVYQRIQHILLPKDYVRLMLTDQYAMDMADGSGTLLMNVSKRCWSELVCGALEIPSSWLPPLYEGTQVTGSLTATAAALTGLRVGTPVVAGGGDQAAGAVGVGAVNPGVVSLSLGTSGVVFASTNQPFLDPQGRVHSFCHCVPNTWHLMGVMLSAAGSLRWWRDTLRGGANLAGNGQRHVEPLLSYEALSSEAAAIAPGAEGLLFLPYLTGERTPHPDPLARGAFVGLTVRHGLPHMTRAVLEGVAFGLRDSLTLMMAAGLPAPSQVRISGGGARSAVWRQILADVLQSELVTVNTNESVAFGAALLSAVGIGLWPNVPTACAATIHVTGVVKPSDNSDLYTQRYQLYGRLYPALRSVFERLR